MGNRLENKRDNRVSKGGQGLIEFGDETKENNQGLGGCDPWTETVNSKIKEK